MAGNKINGETTAIMKMVEAWESLPADNVTVPMMERWLRQDLQPAINVLRVFIPDDLRSEDTKRAIRRMTNAPKA